MTTPQEIREKVFEKAVFNGYDMAAVDDFMDSVATEIGLLQKENTALKAKMKVLVDKIEEYRNNESALNMAMLSAQKLSVQIESDARSCNRYRKRSRRSGGSYHRQHRRARSPGRSTPSGS